jgi:molecular chaperone IbpA
VDSADFDNGLLSISLKRVVPDEMKPRKIEIGQDGSVQKLLQDRKTEERQAA